MSSTNSFSPRWAASSGSPSGPAGLGVSKVWLASHHACQRVSMSWASAAVYRNGGVSVVLSGAWALVLVTAHQPKGPACASDHGLHPVIAHAAHHLVQLDVGEGDVGEAGEGVH